MIGPPAPSLEQADAAQDERAHDALAELGFGNEQRPQPVRRDNDTAHRLERGRIRKRRPPGHLRQFAEELAGSVGDNFAMLPKTGCSG